MKLTQALFFIAIPVILFSCGIDNGNEMTNETFISKKDSLKEHIRTAYDSVKKFRLENPHMYDFDVVNLRNEIQLSEEICQEIQVMLQENRFSNKDVDYVKGQIRNLSKIYERDRFYIDTIRNIQLPDANKLTFVIARIIGKTSLKSNLRNMGIEVFTTTLQFTKQYQVRLKRMRELRKQQNELIQKGLLQPF